MEPLDLWTAHLPTHLRGAGPRIEMRDDIACLMVEDTVVRRFGTLRTPDDGGQSFTRGANDAEGRLRDLDADGVWGEVIYPNIAFFCCFEIRSAELQAASARLAMSTIRPPSRSIASHCSSYAATTSSSVTPVEGAS